MRGRVLVVVLALAAVAIAVAASGDEPKNSGTAAREGTPTAPGGVQVSFLYSTEKPALIDPLVKRFNSQRHTTGGKQIVIDARAVSSGDVETQIAREQLKPVAWSPASSLWGRVLNFDVDRDLAPDDSPSIVRTPLVIAMWEPMARALGWPRRQIGFGDLVRLARSNAGWGEFGHPEFGQFKLVHTNPDFSTSGLSAVVAEYYSATGKTKNLTEDDVTSSRARGVVRDLERSIVHYGDTTPFVKTQMLAEGQGYASAAVMEEVTLVEFNRERREYGRDRLIAIYPREGTFYSDNPFIVLDADWVKPEQKAAAEVFRRWLAQQITPELAARSNFRTASSELPPPLTAENGIDPRQPRRVLTLPEPRTLNAIRRTWREDRKPARIMLVLDTSSSMNREKRLQRAKDGLHAFLREMAPQDSVGLMAFSDEVPPPLAPIRPGSAQRKLVGQLIAGLPAEGETAIYDATAEAVAEVEALDEADRIDAVVLLTDGEDNASKLQAYTLIKSLERNSESDHRVRVFTIAYSAGAAGSEETLKKISAASGGNSYSADTDAIESIYRQIGSFF
jgi:Ca-activated chloride channel family protein